jgi:5-dehydro-2-deoxygluconokinase
VVFEGEIPAALEDGLVARGADVEIYNVLGAGDAFLAGFLRGYLRDAPLATSARLANACGALAVSRLLCSSEFPTLAELEHFLDHGSEHRALRNDAQLNHLHWATTRRREPSSLLALCVDPVLPGTQMLPPAPAAAGKLAHLRQLAIAAVARVAAARADCGIVLDGPGGFGTGQSALHGGLWTVRTVQCARSQPAGLVSGDSLAALTEWPMDVTVRCQLNGDPDEEQDLQRVASACRAQGRELLVGIGARSAAHALARIYALGVRPDWWQLEPQADGDAWGHCASVIAQHDGHCRGMLVSVSPGQGPAALTCAASTAAVRGFIAGGSIFAAAAAVWLAGELSDEAAIADIAGRFRVLVEAWSVLRDRSMN